MKKILLNWILRQKILDKTMDALREQHGDDKINLLKLGDPVKRGNGFEPFPNKEQASFVVKNYIRSTIGHDDFQNILISIQENIRGKEGEENFCEGWRLVMSIL